jgi:anti-sigma B factor antagonist
MAEKNPHLKVEDIGAVTLIRLMDRSILDEETILPIRRGLFKLVESGKSAILLDFSNVEHLSSSMLGVLIKLNGQVAGQLKLCSIRPSLMEVFKITRLHEIVQIYDDMETALDSFR